jgi:N-acetyl-alpha-D-muramate 1-phosphate uridylyltransferase
MIFAAGLGTRLGAIGQNTPKALIEVGGITMIERTVRRAADAGATRIVVNVHHQAERIERFLDEHDLGVEILVSREPDRPLETGGGLWHARALFRRDVPILIHNVDVITDADLGTMASAHARSGALATLAVNERASSRSLLFDERGLFGREDRRQGTKRIESRPSRGAISSYAFAGIHVVAPGLLDRITERGVFSIVDVYLRLAAEGETITPWPLEGGQWLEIGNAERLEAARAALGGSSA